MKTHYEFFRIVVGIFLPTMLAYLLGVGATSLFLPDIQMPAWKIITIFVCVAGVLYLFFRWLFLWLLVKKIYKNPRIYFWGIPD